MANRLLKNSLSPVPRLLGASAVAAVTPGTTTETVLATIPLSAGVMGANGMVRIWTRWNIPKNANTKEMFIRLGGTGVNGTILFHQFISDANQSGWYGQSVIQNRNSQASQIGDAEFGNGGGQFGQFGAGLLTATVDTSVAQNIYITGRATTVGTDVVTLQSYAAELIPLA